MISYGKIYLSGLYWWNRLWYARLKWNLRGRVDFGDGCDIWVRNFRFKGCGRLKLGMGCVMERNEFPSIFEIDKGAEVILGERIVLRGKYCANVITAFENSRIEIGDGSLLNGCIITARKRIHLGRKVLLSWGVSLMDSDLHDLSNKEKAELNTVEIGDYVLVGAYCVVLPGVKIGSHCVIGSGSIVSRDIPDHSVAVGAPARVIRKIDDRDLAL